MRREHVKSVKFKLQLWRIIIIQRGGNYALSSSRQNRAKASRARFNSSPLLLNQKGERKTNCKIKNTFHLKWEENSIKLVAVKRKENSASKHNKVLMQFFNYTPRLNNTAKEKKHTRENIYIKFHSSISLLSILLLSNLLTLYVSSKKKKFFSSFTWSS